MNCLICYLSSSNVNSVGLVFDIAGVILLFLFGLSPEVNPNGEMPLMVDQEDESEAKKYKKYKRMSHVALLLLCIGFIFQITSNYIK